MGFISRLFNFTAGTAIDSEQVDAEFNQILALLNGNLDSVNLKDGTVDLVDLTAAVKNNFPKLATAGDHKENFGVATVTLSGGSGTLAGVAHGLPTTPIGILVTPKGFNFMAAYANEGATTFDIEVTERTGSYSGPAAVFWRAIS